MAGLDKQDIPLIILLKKIPDLSKKLDICRRSCRSCWLCLLLVLLQILKLIEALHYAEYAEGNDDEADDRIDEDTISDSDFRIGLSSCLENDLEIREIDSSDGKSDDRHDDIIDSGSHDCGECSTDNHTYCHIEHISTCDELSELSKESCVFRVYTSLLI